MRIGVMLQARLASSRFPRKILASLGDTTILGACMRRLERVPADAYVVATDLGSLGAISPLCQPPWEAFAGHPEDVMERLIEAAKYHNVDVILRATGDNPLVDPEVATYLLGVHMRSAGEASRPMGMTKGTGVEVVNRGTLEELHPIATHYQREHVMPLVYELRPTNVVWFHETYPVEVSVDTPEDLERVRGIYESGRIQS